MKTIPGILALIALLAPPLGAGAQEASDRQRTTLPQLLEATRAANPEIRAARRMAEAAAARVPQAGALPDPVLSGGVMNLSGLAMPTVQLAQMFPAPGSRGALEAIETQALAAAERGAQEVELGVTTRLKGAYYELHFLDEAARVLERNRALLVDFSEIARARFAVGRAPQQDVLRAQTEVSRLDQQLAGLAARRSAALAELNAILDRPADHPIQPAYPGGVLALADAPPAAGAFTATALEGVPLEGVPGLAELQSEALRARPALLAQAHRVERARSALRLAERRRFPGVEVMVGYGAQPGVESNRLSAMLAVPLPVFSGRKQSQAVAEAAATLEAEELERRALSNQVASQVATRFAEVVRSREQVVLLSHGVIPQARATIESSAAAYQSGTVDFLSLLDAHAALFRNEVELARQLADFGRALARLEHAVGIDLNLENGS